MAYTYEELRGKTVAQLREIATATDSEAVQGYSQLNKEHLLVALARALNLEVHAHHEAKGIDKTALKTQIRELKKERDSAIAAHDRAQLKTVRRKIHRLKHLIHRSEL